jgi:hypothetical protein
VIAGPRPLLKRAWWGAEERGVRLGSATQRKGGKGHGTTVRRHVSMPVVRVTGSWWRRARAGGALMQDRGGGVAAGWALLQSQVEAI